MRTWSGMSARNRIVTAPLLARDRSAYSRPDSERLLSAKLSWPLIRNLPSVEILIVTRPLNTACEVYIE